MHLDHMLRGHEQACLIAQTGNVVRLFQGRHQRRVEIVPRKMPWDWHLPGRR